MTVQHQTNMMDEFRKFIREYEEKRNIALKIEPHKTKCDGISLDHIQTEISKNPEEDYEFQERAAIREFNGQQSRADAERYAKEDVDKLKNPKSPKNKSEDE